MRSSRTYQLPPRMRAGCRTRLRHAHAAHAAHAVDAAHAAHAAHAARRARRSHGTTVAEILVVTAVLSVLLGILAVLLAGVNRTNRGLQSLWRHTDAMVALQRRFRDDVRNARRVSHATVSGNLPSLLVESDGETIHYVAHSRGVSRCVGDVVPDFSQPSRAAATTGGSACDHFVLGSSVRVQWKIRDIPQLPWRQVACLITEPAPAGRPQFVQLSAMESADLRFTKARRGDKDPNTLEEGDQ